MRTKKKKLLTEFGHKVLSFHVSERRRKLKLKAIEYKGGACERCGYNKCVASLVFHHIDPDKKDFGISAGETRSWEKLKVEVDKCMLLCHNCHNELHWEIHENNRLKLINEIEEDKKIYQQNAVSGEKVVYKTAKYKDWPSDKKLQALLWKMPIQRVAEELGASRKTILKRAKQLGLSLPSKWVNWAYKKSSPKLSPKTRIRIQWPSKNELQTLLWQLPTSTIAKQLGVSDKAVEKHAKKLGLTKPPRGYWRKKETGKV